jgi:16S rRNA (adenine1518-N6/adenine1519-N6)-dimethyltransferase
VSAAEPDPEAADFDPATAPLTSPRVVAQLLARHGLRADKGLGQHFLIDPSVTEAVVAASGVTDADEVWEVGPGLGVLTRALSAAARTVVSVELDARLLPLLRETLAHATNVELVEADALTVDLGRAAGGSRFAANLPYNVGTAVLVRVLTSGRFTRVGVVLQREVAERLVASPATPAYGALSLIVAHHGRARITRRVAPGAFLPPPAVTSAVVRVDVEPGVAADPVTFALVRAGFRHRRKTLLGNLRLAGVDAAEAGVALRDLGLDPRVRAEALDLATFRALAGRLPVLDAPHRTHP